MHRVRIILLISISCITTLLVAQNQQISNGPIFDGEPYLAVNPANPQHMVVAWMGYVPINPINIRTRVTFDGGKTWSGTITIPHAKPLFSSADPSLAFDGSGDVYVVYVDYSRLIDSGSVFLRKSTDGGLSWGAPVEVLNMHDDPGKLPIDRPWIAVDRSGGPNDGNIYVASMCAKGATGPFHPYFMRSINGGASFEPWKYLDTVGWLSGSLIPQPMATPAVSSNGTVHAIYPSFVLTQNLLPQYIIASSSNGGNSFTYHQVYASSIVFNDSLAKKGYLLRADPSNANHLAFFYLGNDYGDGDVFIRESMDGGMTWSPSQRVNDDPIGNNRMQDLVWADFDTDGDLVVSWRDRRNASDSTYQTASEIWGAVRWKDSTNFSANFRLSDTQVAYDTILAGSGNDFMNVRMADDTLNAVWGDTRNGHLSIWFQRMSAGGTILSVQELAREEIPAITIYPNPANNHVMVTGFGLETIIVYDQQGKKVETINQIPEANSVDVSLNDLPSGVYFIHVQTDSGSQVQQVIKQ